MQTRTAIPDFDVLHMLYQRNPLAFEELRKQILHRAVAAAPARHMPALQRTLLRIEAARLEAATPLEAATTAFKLMHESVDWLQALWNELNYEVAGLQTIAVIERARKSCQGKA
ncbi:hypothetical protein BH11PSE11_BH11PSE11_05340 [soil metagenome]